MRLVVINKDKFRHVFMLEVQNCYMYENISLQNFFLYLSMIRLWTNWDSPVDGVGESVISAFRCLLEVWHQAIETGTSDYHTLTQDLVDRALQVPWFARSRYRPLTLLIPYVDTAEVSCFFSNSDMTCVVSKQRTFRNSFSRF